jgi:type IV secretion system protein VirB8
MSMPDVNAPVAGWQIDPAKAEALQAAFDAAQGFQTWRSRFLNWAQRIAGIAAVVFLVLDIVEAGTIAYLVPAQRIETQLMFLQPDGTWDSARRIQDLPPDKEVAAVRAALWLYVKNRESYTWDDMPDRYDFVNAMSSGPVRKAYDLWIDPHNKESPQQLMRDGHISVEKISGPFITSPKLVPTPAVIRYKRILDKKDALPQCTTWTVNLDFALTNRMSEKTRDSGDPGGIVIENYQAQEDSVDAGECK